MLRGTRLLLNHEARSIAFALRKHCPGWFDPEVGKDRIIFHILDGVRYRSVTVHQRGSPKISTSGSKKIRLKRVYLVNKFKFHSQATADELQLEINLVDIPDGYTQDDTHRILHCKLR
jgi:hypothetical protein